LKHINLIYGKSGTGKSEYIYKDMDKKIDKFQKIFIIVPEQSNLTSEKKFFEITGRQAMLNVEVLTLSRMAYRVFDEIGHKNKGLSSVGKTMLIYDILNKNKSALNFLGKSEKNIDVINKMFTEFKKHDVSVENLKNVEIEDRYTELKLKDIWLLYEEYQNRISEKYFDENDELTILKDNIKKSKMFENSCIYIDEFFGFTPQEYGIFEGLLKKCDEMNIAICLDNIESSKNKESDIFYFNRKYAKKILEIASSQDFEIKLVNMNESYRFKNKELLLLEQNLSNNKTFKYEENTKNIELFLANNPYSEVEYVAKKIYYLVKNQGYKYREIGIITNDIESYSEDSRAIFPKYDIPVFIDEKKSLNQNILIKYIISLLDIFEYNWSFDSVFNYLKIGLLDIDYYEIWKLEIYCKKWGIKNNKFFKSFNYEPLNENQEKLENLRKKIINPLVEFKENFMQNKNAKEITKMLYEFLINNHIIESLDKKIKTIEMSNEYNTSYKILLDILEEIVELFGNENITFEKYKELLKVGVLESELGKIPATQDQVILGDLDRTRSNKIKVLFVIRNE